MASALLHSFANIINYIYSKLQNDLAFIGTVMGQNVKHDTDFPMYFYQIRRFDITAFAYKAPKVQEVLRITLWTPPFVCKDYDLYIKQISERSRQYSGRVGPECETRYRFRYVHRPQKVYEQFGALRIRPLQCNYFNSSLSENPYK